MTVLDNQLCHTPRCYKWGLDKYIPWRHSSSLIQYVLVDFHTIPERTAYWFSIYPEQHIGMWEGQGLDVHVAIFTLYLPVGTPQPPPRFSAPLNSHGDQLVCSDVRSSFQNWFSHHTYSAMSHILTQLHHTYMYSAMSHILSVTHTQQQHILRNITHTQQCLTYSETSHIHVLSNVTCTGVLSNVTCTGVLSISVFSVTYTQQLRDCSLYVIILVNTQLTVALCNPSYYLSYIPVCHNSDSMLVELLDQ